jgi:hypothetical protein
MTALRKFFAEQLRLMKRAEYPSEPLCDIKSVLLSTVAVRASCRVGPVPSCAYRFRRVVGPPPSGASSNFDATKQRSDALIPRRTAKWFFLNPGCRDGEVEGRRGASFVREGSFDACSDVAGCLFLVERSAATARGAASVCGHGGVDAAGDAGANSRNGSSDAVGDDPLGPAPPAVGI